MTRSFRLIGDTPPASPVVVSVPHAGRDYPVALRDSLRKTIRERMLLHHERMLKEYRS